MIDFKVRIDRASEPPKIVYSGKWKKIVLRMRDKESILLPSVSKAMCLQSAIQSCGFSSTRRHVNGGYRVWFLKRPHINKEYKLNNNSNWDVDITNLPIPDSAWKKRSVK